MPISARWAPGYDHASQQKPAKKLDDHRNKKAPSVEPILIKKCIPGFIQRCSFYTIPSLYMHTKDFVHDCLLPAPVQSKGSCAFTPQLFCRYPKRYTKLMDVDFPPKECFIDKFPVILVGRYIIDLHSCSPPLHTTVFNPGREDIKMSPLQLPSSSPFLVLYGIVF